MLIERKLDSKTVSCYFVGYLERLRDFKFYDSLSKSFFNIRNGKFLENVECSGSAKLKNIVFEEEYIPIPTIATNNDKVIAPIIMQDANTDNQHTHEISLAYIKEFTPTHVKE